MLPLRCKNINTTKKEDHLLNRKKTILFRVILIISHILCSIVDGIAENILHLETLSLSAFY